MKGWNDVHLEMNEEKFVFLRNKMEKRYHANGNDTWLFV